MVQHKKNSEKETSHEECHGTCIINSSWTASALTCPAFSNPFRSEPVYIWENMFWYLVFVALSFDCFIESYNLVGLISLTIATEMDVSLDLDVAIHLFQCLNL
jgi:hypothetical protein